MAHQTIKRGYNSIADAYVSERHLLRSDKYVRTLANLLPPSSTVLDIGCGAGEPIDDILLSYGHSVIGIDISEEMIRRAKINCPSGQYSVADISTLRSDQYSVNAVVSFYALFHIPRESHARILRTLASYVPRGGMLLITLGDKDFEGTTTFYGTTMWWSQWGPGKNREIVMHAGFNIVLDRIDTTGSERHHVLLAEKN